MNEYCRKNNIKFISIDVYGCWSRLFNDFGDEFEVIDKNGEDPIEVVIEDITNAENGIVKLINGALVPFDDNDYVVINNVEGMQKMQKSND